jgi:thiamine kinase-like enzyme
LVAASLEDVIALIPHWADRSDLQVTPLSGGMTNHNYRVDVGGESFVLRIAGTNSHLLGINRRQEYEATVAAGAIGLAPEVVAYNEAEGYLVTRFIKGQLLTQSEMQQQETIRRILDALDRLHRVPASCGSFSVFQRSRMLTANVRQLGIQLPRNFDWMAAKAEEIEQALRRVPVKPCLCHNDLGRRNFIDDGRIRLVDWEYAGTGDPYFDLANLCANQSYRDDQEEFVVGYYFGRVTRGRVAHLKLMKIMSDYHEMLWCLIQSRISQLSTDFMGYAVANADFLSARMSGLEWSQWLADIGRDT